MEETFFAKYVSTERIFSIMVHCDYHIHVHIYIYICIYTYIYIHVYDSHIVQHNPCFNLSIYLYFINIYIYIYIYVYILTQKKLLVKT